MVYAIILFVKDFFQFSKQRKHNQQYMFMATYNGQIIAVNSFLFYVVIGFRFEEFWNIILSPKITIAISIILALQILLNYAIKKVFPKMLEEEINTKYSHLNIKLAL